MAAIDPLLVARAQLGDLRALDALLARVQGPLHRHVRAITGDDELAADALQEALLTVSRKLGTVREPRWFTAWAYRVATRAATRLARRARTLDEPVDPAALDAVAHEAEPGPFDEELVRAVPAMLDALPAASRLVLRMHYLDELTLVEVAEALELSPGTVKSRLAYGLALLRRRAGAQTTP